MWKTLSKIEAKKEFNKWDKDKVPNPSCNGKYIELRNKLLNAHQAAQKFLEENIKDSNKKDYLYDLRLGLEIYQMLNEDFNFTPRLAANDQIWIYLQINVIPDLVYERWGYSEARFFQQSRRIYLKTIWWYIHLSWKGNKEKTYEILKWFTTDEIVQLVERSGSNGYRIDLTREIMNQFSNIKLTNQSRNLFRKIMKLNTARIKIVEPSLTYGGTKKYVEELINYFVKN